VLRTTYHETLPTSKPVPAGEILATLANLSQQPAGTGLGAGEGILMARNRKNNEDPVAVRLPDNWKSHPRQKRESLTDWRSISDDREKYQAYLCSREWAEKREAVRRRFNGRCERCSVLPMAACHHLTYARKYDEPLEDLQAICQPCHDFTHGKHWFDPTKWISLLCWLDECKSLKSLPAPWEFISQLLDEDGFAYSIREYLVGERILRAARLNEAADAMRTHLPFLLPDSWTFNTSGIDPQSVAFCYDIIGFSREFNSDWKAEPDEGE